MNRGAVIRGKDAMFLKRLERRKNGKGHTYWALVESIRTARGSRHRVVAYLGELKKSQQNGWAQLGRRLDRKDRPSPSLFDPPRYDEPPDDAPVLVKLKGVRLERLRDFGDVWLALGLWRLLGLDELLARRMPDGREEVAWPVMAAILTIARLCEPASELHVEDTWYRRTALEDLLGVPPAKPQGKVHLTVTWTRNERWNEWAALSEGCYLLRTTLTDTDPATLWKRYIQLTEAEWAFRIEKDELEIRPIWYQKEERVRSASRILLPAHVLLLLVLVGGCTAAQPRTADHHRCTGVPVHRADPEAAIRAVLDQQVAAWNRGDIEAFMATYWPSDELTFSGGGQVRRGWTAVRERYKARYPSPQRMGKLAFTDLEIRLLGEQAALVLGRWRLTDTPEAGGGVFALVPQRIGRRWLIIHDHTSVEPVKAPATQP